MRGRLHIALLGLGGAALVAGGLLAACAPDTSAPTLQRRTPSTGQITGEVVATSSVTTQNVILAPFTDQACLDCHTDQEMLTQLAVADEPKESLSEGPG